MKSISELADEYSQEATRLKERIEKLQKDLKAAKKKRNVNKICEIEKKIITYEVMYNEVVYSYRQLKSYNREGEQ